MIQSQEVIEKIASLNYGDLHRWIKNRLEGKDELFGISKEEERRKFELIAKAYGRLCGKGLLGENDFTITKFNPIMELLIEKLRNIEVNRKRIEENKEYIYELISLFERIPDFKLKSFLYEFARDGNFKGIKAYDDIEETDLHRVILCGLATHRTLGDQNWWIDQIINDQKNKWYVGISFYALLNRGYRLDIILDIKPFKIFIDIFKEDKKELESCIEAIFNGYGKEPVLNQLRNIDEKLTGDQRAAVKSVLKNFGL